MTPRPIHRWKSFWLGLLVLVFLVWAWWDSTGMTTSFGYRLPSAFIGTGQAHSSIAFTRFEASPLLPGEQRWFYFRDDLLEGSGDPLFPPAVRTEESITRIAHWLLILLHLIAWLPLLGWRWKQMNRPAAQSP